MIGGLQVRSTALRQAAAGGIALLLAGSLAAPAAAAGEPQPDGGGTGDQQAVTAVADAASPDEQGADAPGAGGAAPETAPPGLLDPEEQAALEAAALLAAERSRVSRFAAGELARVRAERDTARAAAQAANAELAQARAAVEDLAEAERTATSEEQSARRKLGNLARQAYAAGPTEWALIEAFLESENPGDALRRASVSQRLAEHADGAWDRTVFEAAALAASLEAARERAASARTGVLAAQRRAAVLEEQSLAIERALAAGGIAEADGARAIATMCEGKDHPLCDRSPWSEGLLTRDAVVLMRVVGQRWPEIATVGGYRAGGTYPDHPTGRAIDVMVPDAGRSRAGADLGDEIAEHLMANADRYGIMYLIWEQRIWFNGRDPVAPVEEWRAMADRGDWTSNHMDHVHVTVSTGMSGQVLLDALRAEGAGG